ncbi:hypothetical protein CTA2_2593 [Colletotrichum tanaceti]|nr:hypothetical protein CTA2_2593 [Colletotrichum tanaceti]
MGDYPQAVVGRLDSCVCNGAPRRTRRHRNRERRPGLRDALLERRARRRNEAGPALLRRPAALRPHPGPGQDLRPALLLPHLPRALVPADRPLLRRLPAGPRPRLPARHRLPVHPHLVDLGQERPGPQVSRRHGHRVRRRRPQHRRGPGHPGPADPRASQTAARHPKEDCAGLHVQSRIICLRDNHGPTQVSGHVLEHLRHNLGQRRHRHLVHRRAVLCNPLGEPPGPAPAAAKRPLALRQRKGGDDRGDPQRGAVRALGTAHRRPAQVPRVLGIPNQRGGRRRRGRRRRRGPAAAADRHRRPDGGPGGRQAAGGLCCERQGDDGELLARRRRVARRKSRKEVAKVHWRQVLNRPPAGLEGEVGISTELS